MASSLDKVYDNDTASSYKGQNDLRNYFAFGKPLHEHTRLRAILSNWSTPGNFHVNFVIFKRKQEEMEKRMDMVYKRTENLSHLNFDSIVGNDTMGLPVAVWENGKWQRGKIASEPQNSLLVFLVDVGYQVLVPLKRIRPLFREFSELPPLAFNCYLQGLEMRNVNEYLMQKLDIVMKENKEFDCEISSWDDIMFLPVNMYERGSPLDVIHVHLSSYFERKEARLAQQKRDQARHLAQQISDDELDIDDSI
ncbi:hypothetical protein T4B_6691 [Trichinella pseudospiralis]|uniref:Tudor domain-containing protein n=1 Tax=Trichinella pseudospiralis TaxID=6337 RepID=A0A0V1DSB6_TRIPS|nr:hypothetical protein T4A_142 [Trichinella pseudospiralis]KRY65539.1 hypothetical protein T4A_12736 [Trichinella pseudospiralis]KRY99922.1 hypothetical protein T4B_14064 [Trichinella pseudospiralis]KRZ02611.1 hypothetical protein T4B_6691 [Trichinella pseudospiralis]KRZ26461.1 hypothetical protein T4C_14079 [Trichinella pseudospiralis]